MPIYYRDVTITRRVRFRVEASNEEEAESLIDTKDGEIDEYLDVYSIEGYDSSVYEKEERFKTG